uniref:Uncharacterized protein n=1 Tax=Anguilla anguilla TaxID=7936 RepID=A0A0E9RL46_ANGAN
MFRGLFFSHSSLPRSRERPGHAAPQIYFAEN